MSETKTVSNDFVLQSVLSAREYVALNFVFSVVHSDAIETELHSMSEMKKYFT